MPCPVPFKANPSRGRGPRIAYLLAAFPVLSETFIFREIRALAGSGLEVEIFALRRFAGIEHKEASELASRVHYRGGLRREFPRASCACADSHPLCSRKSVILHAVLRRSIFRPSHFARLLRNIPAAIAFGDECARRGVSHVHAHFASLPADLAAIISSSIGVSHSFSAHASDVRLEPPRLLRARMAEASFVAACTAENRDYLAGLLPDTVKDRVLLVRHGVFPEEFPMADPVGFKILAVGRLVEKKGFGCLLKACAILRDRGLDFNCSIAGDGPMRAQLVAEVKSFRLENLLTMTGALTQDGVRGLLARSAVFVQPSVVTSDGDRDGIPNAMLEAMASGIPVVASDLPSIKEAVEDGESGFIFGSGNAEDLARKIFKLHGEPGLRKTLGLGGRKKVMRCYDARKNAVTIAELLVSAGSRHIAF